jgi:4'-phosphopantetheinyl transferase
VPLATTILSEPELKRAARLVFTSDQRRFCTARLALRRILSLYLRRPPPSLLIATREGGKPYLEGCEIEFNLSHSGNTFICAIARGTPVGVDVEQLRAVPDCLSLARHHFTSAEADALAELPKEHREHAFLTCWTRKEAYLKLLGLGILDDLNAFVAGLGPEVLTIASISPNIVGPAYVRTFSPAPDTIAALSFTEKPDRVKCFVAPDTWLTSGTRA